MGDDDDADGGMDAGVGDAGDGGGDSSSDFVDDDEKEEE